MGQSSARAPREAEAMTGVSIPGIGNHGVEGSGFSLQRHCPRSEILPKMFHRYIAQWDVMCPQVYVFRPGAFIRTAGFLASILTPLTRNIEPYLQFDLFDAFSCTCSTPARHCNTPQVPNPGDISTSPVTVTTKEMLKTGFVGGIISNADLPSEPPKDFTTIP